MSKVLTTPKGTAVYPHLKTPDTHFNLEGVYNCKLHVSEEDFNVFSKQVFEVVDRDYDAECKIKGKKLKLSEKPPLRITADGEYEIYAKQVAKRQTKKGLLEFTVPIFDSKGSRVQDVPNIGSGSKLKLSLEIYTWYSDLQGFGYTLRLKAAQLLELMEYSSGGSVFGKEDGSYIDDGESLDTAFTEEEAPSGIGF
jgi:hypothetical protein